MERSLNLITNTDRWGRRSGRWGRRSGRGGGGLVGREDDERLILNLLDNDLSFQPNAFVTRNYHSLGGGSLEKLGGRGGTRNFFIPITFLKIVL